MSLQISLLIKSARLKFKSCIGRLLFSRLPFCKCIWKKITKAHIDITEVRQRIAVLLFFSIKSWRKDSAIFSASSWLKESVHVLYMAINSDLSLVLVLSAIWNAAPSSLLSVCSTWPSQQVKSSVVPISAHVLKRLRPFLVKWVLKDRIWNVVCWISCILQT